MIKCNSCESVSQDALILKEVHYECDGNPYEAIPVCPYCYDTDIFAYEGNDFDD
ncbi:MAG: hypothetical protein IJE46_06290 [Clostridia bacterium]|nr:hypothetical protein [Clostridia bacterium]